jgi:hypothetical protein
MGRATTSATGSRSWPDEFDCPRAPESAVDLYLGTPAGPTPAPTIRNTSGTPSSFYGCSVASGGDVNGDGLDDVVAGALAYNGPEIDEGAVLLYFGR